jgi:hypothetical protein
MIPVWSLIHNNNFPHMFVLYAYFCFFTISVFVKLEAVSLGLRSMTRETTPQEQEMVKRAPGRAPGIIRSSQRTGGSIRWSPHSGTMYELSHSAALRGLYIGKSIPPHGWVLFCLLCRSGYICLSWGGIGESH